jgi:hypothetical protein
MVGQKKWLGSISCRAQNIQQKIICLGPFIVNIFFLWGSASIPDSGLRICAISTSL